VNNVDINKLKEIGEVTQYKEGETIIYQGLYGEEMFIILKGAVEVFVLNPFNGTEAHVADLGAGDVFGEMSIFQGGKRSASIRAVEGCVLFKITKDSLESYIKVDPSLAVKLMKVIAQRLVEAEGYIKDHKV